MPLPCFTLISIRHYLRHAVFFAITAILLFAADYFFMPPFFDTIGR